MKKKFIFGLIGLLSFSSIINASTLEARIPTTIPNVNATVYAGVDEAFDYSKISFTSATSGGSDIVGSSTMKKIFMSASPVTTISDSETDKFSKRLGSDYFSAYCLDSNVQVPEYNTTTFNGTITEDNKVLFALYNDSSLYSVFESVKGYGFTSITYTLKSEDTTEGTKTYSVSNIKYTKINGTTPEEKTILAKDLAKNESATTFDITFKESDIIFSKYTTTTKGTDTYDKAFWISEHAYPSISLENTYSNAGSSYINVLSELSLISEGKTETVMKSSTNDLLGSASTVLGKRQQLLDYVYKCSNNQLGSTASDYYKYIAKGLNENLNGNTALQTELGVTTLNEDGSGVNAQICQKALNYYVSSSDIKNYTYSTVQYAIWKVSNGYESNGNKLGDTLKGSSELNKLYQYLIKDRDEASSYSTYSYTNKLSINKPESGKEIYKNNTDDYIYGPYTVSGTVLELTKIKLSVVNSTSGVTIVDKDGNTISEIKGGEEFYIKCLKSAKIANVSIKAEGEYLSYDNRARVYYANTPLLQNVITGGKMITGTSTEQFDLVFNPKTGYFNLAIIFVISIVAFTIGYIVLNHKNPEINFD